MPCRCVPVCTVLVLFFLGEYVSWTTRPLDYASRGQCVPWTMRPWTMRPWDDASLGQCVPWTMPPLDNASLGQCLPWMMRPLDNAFIGQCVPWTIRPLDDASPGRVYFGLSVPWTMGPVNDASLIDVTHKQCVPDNVSRPWTRFSRWIITTAGTRRNLCYPGCNLSFTHLTWRMDLI